MVVHQAGRVTNHLKLEIMTAEGIKRAITLLEQLYDRQVSAECGANALKEIDEKGYECEIFTCVNNPEALHKVLKRNHAIYVMQAEEYKRKFMELVFDEFL